MKPLAFIAFLLLCGFSNSLAQTSAWEKAYNDLPPKERDEYYENARFFLENVYYYQLAEAIEDSDIHEFLIKDLFGDENNVGAARFQPECLLEKSEQRFLTPSQYLQTLSNAFQENAAGLEFLAILLPPTALPNWTTTWRSDSKDGRCSNADAACFASSRRHSTKGMSA